MSGGAQEAYSAPSRLHSNLTGDSITQHLDPSFGNSILRSGFGRSGIRSTIARQALHCGEQDVAVGVAQFHAAVCGDALGDERAGDCAVEQALLAGLDVHAGGAVVAGAGSAGTGGAVVRSGIDAGSGRHLA